jgi:DNA repair exonuclease SbcCD ATPase subunit
LKARKIGGKDNDQIDIIEKNENMVSQQKDLEEKDGEIERLLKEMLDYKTKFEELMEENDELRKGMKQILEDVKEQDGQSDVLIHCPSLEKLVGMYKIIILYLSLHSTHVCCSKCKN